jgi:hypothetical protein
MAVTGFNPAPGNYGEEYIALTRTLPTAVITAANTVRHMMPITAAPVALANQTEMLYYKGGALVIGGTAPSFTQTTTARVVKRSVGGTITPLSAPVTIASGQAQFSVLVFPLLPTATDTDLTIRPQAGDTVLIEVTNGPSGTVTTQPGDVQAGLKFAVLR